jgi:hypothetical protein
MPRLRLLITACVLVLVPAAVAVAGAPSAERFEGTCSMSGTVSHDPPITNTPQPADAVAQLAGTCSGTVTDSRGRERRLDAAPATYAAEASGTLSCGGGTAEGHSVLRLGRVAIGAGFSEVRGPGAAAIRLDGDAGGHATGEAAASSDEDPAQIAADCAGPGLRSVGIDASLATPGISG